MPTPVPLPTGFKGLEDQPRLRENLINIFYTGSGLIRTPALELFASGRGVCRGQGLFQEKPYFASGSRLICVEEDGSVSDLGDIGSGDTVYMASTANEMAIVVRNGGSYVWDGTTLTDTSGNPNFVPFQDVFILNQRAYYIPLDGSPVAFSETNDLGTINAASFIDAQLLPDNNVGGINYRNNGYILGSQSVEVFRPTSNPDIPIARDESASVFDAGYVAGKVLYADTFAFLGRLRNGSYGFHLMGNGSAPRISNPPIEEILNEQYTLAELELCVGMRYKWKGFEVVAFSLKNHTFCFVDGNWFFQESFVEGGNVTSAWRGFHIVNAYGYYLIGDRYGQNIGKFIDGKTDYDEIVEREFTTFARDARGVYFSVSTVSLDCLVGTGSDETDTVGISVSKDGVVYPSVSLWKELGDIGDYQRRVCWVVPGGFGTYENFMGIRVRVTAAVDFAVDALQLD